MTYIDSTACTSRLHCGTCRDRENGVAFRESTGLGAGFECPHGVPWNVTTVASVAVLPQIESHLMRPPRNDAETATCVESCEGCEHEMRFDHDAPGCRLIAGCCGSIGPTGFDRHVRAGGRCPHPEGSRFADDPPLVPLRSQFTRGGGVSELNEFKAVGSG